MFNGFRGIRRRAMGTVLATVAALMMAAPAAADTETLKRSIENLTQFPLDVALSPVVAGYTIYQNMNSIEDSPGVRIFYPIPGFAWNTMVQGAAGILRGMTGLIEFVPGIVLLFSDAEFEPLFDPADENDALVDYETDFYWLKFGVNYTSGSF